MGWGSGGELLRDIASMADPYLWGDKSVEFYTQLIDLFEDHDCDTIDEAVGVSKHLDKAIAKWASQFAEACPECGSIECNEW